jgi:hypothetical protein
VPIDVRLKVMERNGAKNTFTQMPGQIFIKVSTSISQPNVSHKICKGSRLIQNFSGLDGGG